MFKRLNASFDCLLLFPDYIPVRMWQANERCGKAYKKQESLSCFSKSNFLTALISLDLLQVCITTALLRTCPASYFTKVPRLLMDMHATLLCKHTSPCLVPRALRAHASMCVDLCSSFIATAHIYLASMLLLLHQLIVINAGTDVHIRLA